MSETKKTKNLVFKLCEACGEKIFCGADVGKCWCFDLEIKAEILTDLREKFDNCLCKNCLNEKNTASLDV